MSIANYDITVGTPFSVTVGVGLCSAPTYTVSAVSVVAQPVFKSAAMINGVNYPPGRPLISASGGTVLSASPLSVVGATTASVSAVTISGTYSAAATAAAFVIPFGTTFNPATKEHEVGGSPRDYTYTASLVASSGGGATVAETILAGNVFVKIENPIRVPPPGSPPGGSSPSSVCFVRQV